jgi:serine protease Do
MIRFSHQSSIMKRFLIGLAVGIIIFASILGGAIGDRLFGLKPLDRWFPKEQGLEVSDQSLEGVKVLREESLVIDVVDKVSPSVVTVGIKKTRQVFSPFEIDIFDPFGIFRRPTVEEDVEQDIGTGFIVSSDGKIVTNRHVVNEQGATYKIISNDDKEYQVTKIYRDPANDLAILKIDPPSGGLKPVELGDSSHLKVGQFVIAIGTALGEFRHTVTTGVISGLGRGITAGDPFSGYVERIDNVIQTDAAINPGNSGGPLLNSIGQVIGVNVAVSQAGENIAFAIPINVLKESLDSFEKTGSFSRPFLGVRYNMIGRDVALLNDVPEGACIVEVVKDSAADKAGIKEGDIIVEFDGTSVREEDGGLAPLIQKKKVGDEIEVKIWRDEETLKLKVKLEEFSE